MPTRNASAAWEGDLKSGKGTMKLGSGAWQGAYSFQSRFEEGAGTMAFAHERSKAGFVPTRVATTAKVLLEKTEGGFGITRIDLACEAQVPRVDNAKFQEIAQGAKKNCPISKLFTGAQINLDAKLV